MRITQYSDYALRTLIYLAVVPNDQTLVNIQDIADSYHISKNHLTKIVHQLSRLGLIESLRGKNGGIRLAMHPKHINIGSVLRYTEVDFGLVDCFFSTQQAPDKQPTDNESTGANVTNDDDDSFNNHNRAIPLTSETWVHRVEDISPFSACVISPACQLKPVFFEAIQAFLAVFDRYTLADLVSNPDELRALLK